jgi:hypothetical protein
MVVTYTYAFSALCVITIFRRRAKSIKLKPNQEVIYYTGSILENLEDFSSKIVKENTELRRV